MIPDQPKRWSALGPPGSGACADRPGLGHHHVHHHHECRV